MSEEKQWFRGRFYGQYIGEVASGLGRKVYTIRLTRGVVTQLEELAELPELGKVLKQETLTELFTTEERVSFGSQPSEHWSKLKQVYAVHIADYETRPLRTALGSDTIHGELEGTIYARRTPLPVEGAVESPHAVSKWNFLSQRSGCFGGPPKIVKRASVIVLASSLNISSAEVLSVFNLQFFDLSIADLPSENIDIDVDDDGIVNAEDDCPYVPEDYDGFEDEDGCPETDNDNDGIIDLQDRCPNIFGTDESGCGTDLLSKPDQDSDGIPDELDKCPEQPETINQYNDFDGCPDVIPAELKALIGNQKAIQFELMSAALKPSSEPKLNELKQILEEHRDIRLIGIYGFTDNRGTDRYNLKLSAARATAVRDWLVAAGIGKGRLQARGFGANRFIADNSTESGQQANRRVEFACIVCESDQPQGEQHEHP